jgi:hypothetical protein
MHYISPIPEVYVGLEMKFSGFDKIKEERLTEY